MKITTLLIPAGLMALAPAVVMPAQAASAQVEKAAVKAAQDKRPDASIPFANHGGVQDWRADGTRSVYFKDNHRHWCRAELMGTAVDLPYVEHIGIISGPTGALDRFGGILVKGQRFTFRSFDEVAGPPASKAKAHKAG